MFTWYFGPYHSTHGSWLREAKAEVLAMPPRGCRHRHGSLPFSPSAAKTPEEAHEPPSFRAVDPGTYILHAEPSYCSIWRFQKMRGPFLEVAITGSTVYWGFILGPPIYGSPHMAWTCLIVMVVPFVSGLRGSLGELGVAEASSSSIFRSLSQGPACMRATQLGCSCRPTIFL